MLNIPNINGEYKLDCESNGTYHELTMVPKGTINAFITVYIRRQGADAYEQLSNYLITVPTTIEITGTLEDVKVVTTNTTGSGTIFTQLISREAGNKDSASISRAYVQSIARVFPNSVHLVTPGRPYLNTVVIQNRDNQAVYFWHGLFPTDISQTGYLPLDPTNWTAQQKLDAATFIVTYGEKIAAGERYEPHVAQTGPLYSYVASLTAIAHVMVG
jgi:hypothetical protein